MHECAQCGGEFDGRKERKYCSQDCYHDSLSNPRPYRRKQVELDCAYCGSSFTIRESKSDTRQYCSKECSDKDKEVKITYTCEQCGVEFADLPSNDRTYCSKECLWDSRREQVDTECENCGDTYTVNRWRYENTLARFCSSECEVEYKSVTFECRGCGTVVTRQRCYSPEAGYYHCSPECFNEWNTAENHYNWQGGHSTYRGPNWNQQRRLARQRDGHTCRCCGDTSEELGRALDVHHIIPFNAFESYLEANKLVNLISLCQSCHTTIEHATHDATRVGDSRGVQTILQTHG